MDKYIGKVLDDRYEIVSLIGVGGMSCIYKARCRRLSRFVAIKILKKEFENDQEFKNRFQNESNAVARLSHKNIVNIFDVSSENDINYIVMELIEGVSLKEYLEKKEKLDWKQTIFFSSQIAEGLEHAHSRGIIHQDIKPHNIMLLRDGTLKVADFGIAKLENEGETKVIREAIGSVHYISPEQAKGNSIDARTDIYSLGIVMYEMVTGRTPYKGDTAISIVMQHINSLPAPPSSINENMPKSLEYVILKAMNPSLKNRYKSAVEVIEDLEKIKNNPNIIFGIDDDPMNETQAIGREELKHAVSNYNKDDVNQKILSKRVSKTPKKYDDNDDDDYDDYQKRSPKATIVAILLVLIIVVTSVIFAFDKVFIDKPEVINAPDLIDFTYESVIENESFKKFDIQIKEEVISDEPVGTIIDQEPVANSEIHIDTKINVVVSKGPKTETMPNYKDYDYKQAENELNRLDVQNVEVQFSFSEDVLEGKIIETFPESGEQINKNTNVVIYVSSGKEVFLTPVPDLKGLTVEQAKQKLQDAQLVIGEVTEEESLKDVGTIIAQGVQEGVEILSETKVNVVIAKAPPEPVVKTKTITINIPQDTEYNEIYMEVRADNDIVHSKVHDTSEGSFDIEISGEASVEIYVYAEGDLVDERVVTFG